MRKLLPWLLIAIPVLYYFALLVGAATYPGYSHMTRYASELGAAGAPYPELFNWSAIAMGVAALVASPLLAAEFLQMGGKKVWILLAAITMGLWGISMIIGGMFPMPDERHGSYGLGLAFILTPLLLLLGLRNVAPRAMLVFLGVVFIASLVMIAIMFGVGSLVTRANVGAFQRLNSLASTPWVAVLGIWLLRRRSSATEA